MRVMRVVPVVFTILILAGCGDDPSGPSPDQGLHGWIVGDGIGDAPTILHTTDGLEWSSQGTDLIIPGADLSSVSVVDSSIVWVAGGISEGFGVVLKTTDGGETWLRMGNETEIPEPVLCVKAFSADVALISGESNSIYRTTDGGASWSSLAPQGHQGVNWQCINGLSQSNIWVAGGTENTGEMMHSGDGGILWTTHGDSLVQDYTMIGITPFDQNNIWAVGHAVTLIKTTTGGIEWEYAGPDSAQGEIADANGITVLSPLSAWVVLDYDNIWRTEDGGITWVEQQIPQSAKGHFLLRISAVDGNTAWVVGRSSAGLPSGVILHTTDGGNTWTRQDDGTLPAVWDVGFVNEIN